MNGGEIRQSIKHKFLDHRIDPETETLIVGTFNPSAHGNSAEFFYSRPRNYFWASVPEALNEPSLKQRKVGDEYERKIDEKKSFMKRNKIDFIDVSELEVEPGQELNYDDSYIDSKVPEDRGWRDVVGELEKLQLNRPGFAGGSNS